MRRNLRRSDSAVSCSAKGTPDCVRYVGYVRQRSFVIFPEAGAHASLRSGPTVAFNRERQHVRSAINPRNSDRMAAAGPPTTPGNALRVSTTLRLGERVVVRCDDGLLSTEYVLFDATDIVLRATDPVTVRETGYITTARDALARLAAAGVTPELAEEAARS